MNASGVWPLGLVLLAVFLSYWMTGRVRQYALRARLLDVPNHRSSHQAPTPRGGGVAMVGVFLAALAVLVFAGRLNVGVFTGLAGGGLLTACIGYLDDRRHVPAGLRLLAHAVAAGLVITALPLPAWASEAGTLIACLSWVALLLFCVWLLNLYNFMDGIDAIAGGEAVVVAAAGGVMFLIVGAVDKAWVAFLLAGAALGFLLWNLPPAKIFMGDAGSGFLGLMFAALSLWGGSMGVHVLVAWLILLAAFVSDATVTLGRRLVRGERVWEAHRSHAYQRCARHFGGHRPVTLAFMFVNICCLAPIAIAVALKACPVGVGLVLAYVPLVLIVWRAGAGLPDNVPLFRVDT